MTVVVPADGDPSTPGRLCDQGEPSPKVLETWIDPGLSGPPLAVITSEAPLMCVQAGPGTGKSTCMTIRVLRLLQQRKVMPEQVLAISFTTTAAADLRSALRGKLPEQYHGFQAVTLHALCQEILLSEGYVKARGRVARYLVTASKSANLGFEASPIFADMSQHGTATDQSKQVRALGASWARRQKDPLGSPTDDADAAFCANLLSWLALHRCMLLDELVPLAWEFLSSDPDCSWRTKFKVIVVDEYQDLNRADQAVVDLLASGADLTVVGGRGSVDLHVPVCTSRWADRVLRATERRSAHTGDQLEESYERPVASSATDKAEHKAQPDLFDA